MLIITYEYKLEPTLAQEAVIDDWLEICRKVYNYALAERKDWVRSRKSSIHACSIDREYIIPVDAKRPTFASQCKSLAAAKQEIPALKRPHAHVLQQVLRTLEASFVAMWERGHGFPRFKKRMRSFAFPQLNQGVVRGNRVNLPKLGWVKMRLSRPAPEGFAAKQLRVVKRASGYYVMIVFQSDVEVAAVQPHGEPLGIDVGIESYLATSAGELVENPRFFVHGQRKLKSLQGQLKRRKKGSNRWLALQRKIARHHEYLANARKDFQFKLAHHLCDQAGMVFVEKLNLKGLAKGMLAGQCLDAAWGRYLSTQEWVCWKRGVYFAAVEASGTGQECPGCAVVVKKDLSVRIYECPECGYTTNRDVASAQGVRNRGLAAVGHTDKKLREGNAEWAPSELRIPTPLGRGVSNG
ncbi:RNA-guided endonuclease InsQ/TnpB family protein [Lyngbya confervoides]|uniref:Transposase n=1 Tax=Lyngbya confervoides BDU141951 TaxID=1574623 RepID=A0ABD4T7F5_9CYAN|nr:RNA-guided endonuclease TnpB family protein [Lyngbya confervoides]MCM1984684.1 transposase [Lyngbya confervoides BDU141951]